MTDDHKGPRRGRVACRRCRRLVEPPTLEERIVLLDFVMVTDTIFHALETAWLARRSSPEPEARLLELQQMVERTLTQAQRTTLLSIVNYLHNALAHRSHDPGDEPA
jgi:hypothetical protein